MATLDFSKATAFQMPSADLGTFGTLDGAGTSTAWSYLTPAGHKVTVKGQGLTYNAAGRPVSGTATSIEIDLGNDGGPDVVITGIGVAAATLDDGPASFWRVLEGADTILGPAPGQGGPFSIFGDGVVGRLGATGGADDIQFGGRLGVAYGDVVDIGPGTSAAISDYRGGNDGIAGLATALEQGISGDVQSVDSGRRLTGGHDSIVVQSSNSRSWAAGDAVYVEGGDGVLARAIGGNDVVEAGKDFVGILAGDVLIQDSQSVVRGGNDEIVSHRAAIVAGDVNSMAAGRLIGGNDVIYGGDGDETIVGDVHTATADSIITGGDDTIDGGAGNDFIYGDTRFRGGTVVGGDDRLDGGAGNDWVYGEGGDDLLRGSAGSDVLFGSDGNDILLGDTDGDTLRGGDGDDMLDGGSGKDLLEGGYGNDTYLVDDPGDGVSELPGAGIDTVLSTAGAFTLAADVEILRYNGGDAFTGYGNALANTVAGGAGNDYLDGGVGNDVLIGGPGGDALIGGDGIDTASYVTAAGGVDANLGFSPRNAGDAAGDSYFGIENLAGSAFDDSLGANDQANTLSGGAGRDGLFGYGGDDVLIGGAGSDRLYGNVGNDVLRGGPEADLLYGEQGDDVFDFNSIAESAPGARDVIRAFDVSPAFDRVGVAGGDMIDLSGIDANTAVVGEQAFVFSGTGIGRMSVVNSGANSLMRCNIDNDAAFEFELLIEDGAVLASAYEAIDFYL